jgi:hypothetical protein
MEATTKLFGQLQVQFSQHVVNEALSIVWLHYWIFIDCHESFNNDLNVVKSLFCSLKKMKVDEVEEMVNKCPFAFNLDLEKSMSKIKVKNDVQIALGSFNIINHLIKT